MPLGALLLILQAVFCRSLKDTVTTTKKKGQNTIRQMVANGFLEK